MLDRRLLALLLGFAVCAALALQSATPALAAMQAPTGLSPDGGTAGATPVLSWNHVPGTSRYEIQAASTPDFATTLWQDETENRQLATTKALTGEIFWRVRAETSTEQSPWATATFFVDRGAAPVPVTPGDGAELDQPDEAPQLTWEPVTGAVGYEVEIDDAPDFIGAGTPFTTQTTSYSLQNPPAPGERWWRVRAIRNGGQATDWSTPRSFVVNPIPQPELVSPANSPDTVVSDVVLDWSAVAGAKQYEYRVSTDRSFPTATTTSGFTFATRWSPSSTLDNDQYWWQVRAYDSNGQTAAWPDPGSTRTWQFQRAWQFGTQLARPQLVHPADGVSAVADPLRFEWDPVRLASHYALEVGSDPNFSDDTFNRCITRATTYVPSFHTTEAPCSAGAARTMYWRVQALDGPRDVNGVFSDIHSFTYRSGVVTPLTPANGETVSVPSMTWQPYQGAERYQVNLRITVGGSTTTKTVHTYSPSYTFVEQPSSFPATVRWSVQAEMANGALNSDPVDMRTFTLTAPPAATAASPAPLAPAADSHHDRFPALRWQPVQGAATYRVILGEVGSTGVRDLGPRYEYPAATDTAATSIRPGHYYWYVQALTAQNQVIATGAQQRFHVDAVPGVTGESAALRGRDLAAPTTRCDDSLADTSGNALCEQLRQTPVLDWDPVRSASGYMVYIARDRNLTNLVHDPEIDDRFRTHHTMLSLTSLLPDSQAGQAYYWVVRPCKVLGVVRDTAPDVCAPDPTEATHAFDKQSAPVQLSAPAADATVTGEVTLSWEDYLVTNQTPASFGGTGQPATVEARSYRVQVSTTPTFQTTLTNFVVDQTTFTAASIAYPDGPLWWRVAAIDGSGNELASSEARPLTKRTQAPTLTSPVEGQVAPQTPALRWTARPYAASYDVEVYKNDDGNFSVANRVFSTRTKMSVFSLTKPLPASDQAYVWRVRSVNPSNLPGGWSAPGRFTVRGTAPSQTAPSAGAYVGAASGLFTWQAVHGAALYRFELREAGTTVPTRADTASLAYAPKQRLADGRWEWRVLTLDSAAAPVASSPWRSFMVDGTAPSVSATTPGATGKPKVKPSATFSEPVLGVTTATMKLFKKGQQHAVSATVAYVPDKRKAVLDPKQLLTRGTYRVVLAKTIADVAGNALAKTEWTFRVGG